MVQALKPLHDAGRVRRVVVSTYQAVSGAGLAGSRDLEGGTKALLAGEDYKYECFAYPIAFNCIPQIGSPKHKGYTSEEMKMVYETRKMLEDDVDPDLPDVHPRAGEQLPQREHPGRDRAEDHGRGSPQAVRRHAGPGGDGRPGEEGLSDADQLRPAATRRSSAGFARTFPAPTAWRSGASATTSARAPPPTPCRSRSCW